MKTVQFIYPKGSLAAAPSGDGLPYNELDVVVSVQVHVAILQQRFEKDPMEVLSDLYDQMQFYNDDSSGGNWIDMFEAMGVCFRSLMTGDMIVVLNHVFAVTPDGFIFIRKVQP